MNLHDFIEKLLTLEKIAGPDIPVLINDMNTGNIIEPEHFTIEADPESFEDDLIINCL